MTGTRFWMTFGFLFYRITILGISSQWTPCFVPHLPTSLLDLRLSSIIRVSRSTHFLFLLSTLVSLFDLFLSETLGIITKP